MAGGYACATRRRRHRLIAGRVTAAIATMLLGGCSAMHAVGLWSNPGIHSFDGVSFGDGYRDTRLVYPGAMAETSPYGAQSLHLDEVANEGIHYRIVIYEFDDRNGMQLVLAEFDPARTRAVRGWIVSQIGPPSLSGGSSSKISGVNTWKTLNGETVILDGDSRWLAIVGPQGGRLRSDILPTEINAQFTSRIHLNACHCQ